MSDPVLDLRLITTVLWVVPSIFILEEMYASLKLLKLHRSKLSVVMFALSSYLLFTLVYTVIYIWAYPPEHTHQGYYVWNIPYTTISIGG